MNSEEILLFIKLQNRLHKGEITEKRLIRFIDDLTNKKATELSIKYLISNTLPWEERLWDDYSISDGERKAYDDCRKWFESVINKLKNL